MFLLCDSFLFSSLRYCEGDVPCRDLQFEYSPGGKPWLVSEQLADKTTGQLHFNLTHTDRLLGEVLISAITPFCSSNHAFVQTIMDSFKGLQLKAKKFFLTCCDLRASYDVPILNFDSKNDVIFHCSLLPNI